MKIDKRLGELERRLIGSTITLVMQDGSERRLSGRRLIGALRDLSHDSLTDDVRLVAASIDDDCKQRGHGHIGQMIRIMATARMAGPIGSDPYDACEGTVSCESSKFVN